MASLRCFERRFRRTAPARGESGDEPIIVPTHSRINGWSYPLHVLQLMAWIAYGFMVIMAFGVYIPLLPPPWNHISYSVIGATCVVHLLSHLGAVSVDPADYNVRVRKDYSSPMPVFDRKKQPHVIHNQHCFLCQVDVGSKVKHCGSCNKCISDFDHHCKWLNNCVGGRNYWLFFMTLLSAVFGALILIVVILFIFIEYFLNPDVLRTAAAFQAVNRNTTWLAFLPLAPVEISSAGLLVLAFITIIIALASLLLLCHLLIFHVYLLCKGMSTYEYVMKQRQLKCSRQQNAGATASSNEASSEKPVPLETSVDCNRSLSSMSRGIKHLDRARFSSRLSGTVCSETKHFPQAAGGDNCLNHESNSSLEIIPGVASAGRSASVGQVERPSTELCSTAGLRQAEGVPVAQNCLGSFVQHTSAVHQQLTN